MTELAQGSDDAAIVHVGSAARDVTSDDPRGWRLGGGVTYSALTTARLGIPTRAVIGVDAEAAGAVELEVLRQAGVEVLPVPLPEGPVFENIERPTGRVQTCLEPGVPLPLIEVPAAWSTVAWSVVPVAGEVSAAWLTSIPRGIWLVLGWQGFLRRLVAGQRVERIPATANDWLRQAQLIGVSRHDLDPDLPLERITDLLAPGTDLIVTQGPEGGHHLHLDAARQVTTIPYAAIVSDRQVDATGAGDTFLAALVATALRSDLRSDPTARFDLRFAAAAASLVVEDHGLAGVPTLQAVRERLAASLSRLPPARAGTAPPAA
ncbi:MAG TPA: PfkB family carbohydrate kinase [Candidatus Limnocylindrales bacterium]|jgi:sugar/nucleoside kinase (ribokinase family)